MRPNWRKEKVYALLLIQISTLSASINPSPSIHTEKENDNADNDGGQYFPNDYMNINKNFTPTS